MVDIARHSRVDHDVGGDGSRPLVKAVEGLWFDVAQLRIFSRRRSCPLSVALQAAYTCNLPCPRDSEIRTAGDNSCKIALTVDRIIALV
jgi:hypothetical protein